MHPLFVGLTALLFVSGGEAAIHADAKAKFSFEGPIGARIIANREQWLLTAPKANPGMLEMFLVRDRAPEPKIVPWAGEFVGKYLISAIQALRMTEDPLLDAAVREVLDRLYEGQAEDGYLGPFPKRQRLLAHWDLWGHYHVMLALLLWHERTGDEKALAAARRMADLVCDTFLAGKRRAIDAGSTEMNLAIAHGLARLYRVAPEERHLKMIREIEKDWEKAGDYYRTGVAGVDFFKTPKPRWESLHDLQALVELHRITGNDDYRRAFLNHWESIRRCDRRNSGAFSAGEQANGNPFDPAAIETCCTIAWMAITVDALSLTGEPAAADELERSTYNGMLGAQHPSGRWWTYSTPMDGAREASAHSIVFQARAGTPELNCCSVNGPRGLGMLSEWAVARKADGLAIHYFGPMTCRTSTAEGTPATVRVESDYPRESKVVLRVDAGGREIPIFVRVPEWSTATRAEMDGREWKEVRPGEYLAVRRAWTGAERLEIEFDFRLRAEVGDRQSAGKVSVYRGPILLAYDQKDNPFDAEAIPALAPSSLEKPELLAADSSSRDWFAPIVRVRVKGEGGRELVLRDYATAGAWGTQYRSWLPASGFPPPAPLPLEPLVDQAVPSGRILFTWRPSPRALSHQRAYEVRIADDPEMKNVVASSKRIGGSRLVLPPDEAGRLAPGKTYYWKLIASDPHGRTESVGPPRRLRVDLSLPPRPREYFDGPIRRPDGLVASDPLKGKPAPEVGGLLLAKGTIAAPGPGGASHGAVETDGKGGMVLYAVGEFPETDYSAMLWVNVLESPRQMGQIVSAWCGGLDDPLRIVVEGDKVFARIEAGESRGTPGVDLGLNRWRHVAAVKEGGRLRLYVDGMEASSVEVKETVLTEARDLALGGNPHYTAESEHLRARFRDFKFFARALGPSEIAAAARKRE